MTRKDALMTAAKELFGTCGYAQTTFKKISERAGVALGLLAHHYGTKENLFLLANMEVLENLVNTLEQASARGITGLERAMLFCRAYLDFSIAENSHYLLLLRSFPHKMAHTEEGPGTLQAEFQKLYTLLENILEQGNEDKTLDIASPLQTRQVIISLLMGGSRMQLLSSFRTASLYEDILAFIHKSIAANPAH